MSGLTFTARLIGGAATLLFVSACGSGTPNPTSADSPTTTTSGSILSVATTSLGPVLVDRLGHTIYLLTADTPGKSSCSAKCLEAWPLVSAPAGAGVPRVNGVPAALSVTKASSGASMLSAGGWPLYTFVRDKAPGDVNGQGIKSFGGTWYAVSPSGKAVTAPAIKAPATKAPANDSGGSGVGGY